MPEQRQQPTISLEPLANPPPLGACQMPAKGKQGVPDRGNGNERGCLPYTSGQYPAARAMQRPVWRRCCQKAAFWSPHVHPLGMPHDNGSAGSAGLCGRSRYRARGAGSQRSRATAGNGCRASPTGIRARGLVPNQSKAVFRPAAGQRTARRPPPERDVPTASYIGNSPLKSPLFSRGRAAIRSPHQRWCRSPARQI